MIQLSDQKCRSEGEPSQGPESLSLGHSREEREHELLDFAWDSRLTPFNVDCLRLGSGRSQSWSLQ